MIFESKRGHLHCVSFGVLADGQINGLAFHARRYNALPQHLSALLPTYPPFQQVQQHLNHITVHTPTTRKLLIRSVLEQPTITITVIVHRLSLEVIAGDSQSFLRAESDAQQAFFHLYHPDCIFVMLFGEYFSFVDEVVPIATSSNSCQFDGGSCVVGEGVILLMGVVWVMADCFRGKTFKLLSYKFLFSELAAILLFLQFFFYLFDVSFLHLKSFFEHFRVILLFLHFFQQLLYLFLQSSAVNMFLLYFFLHYPHFFLVFSLELVSNLPIVPYFLRQGNNLRISLFELCCEVVLHLGNLHMGKSVFINFFLHQLNHHFSHLQFFS